MRSSISGVLETFLGFTDRRKILGLLAAETTSSMGGLSMHIFLRLDWMMRSIRLRVWWTRVGLNSDKTAVVVHTRWRRGDRSTDQTKKNIWRRDKRKHTSVICSSGGWVRWTWWHAYQASYYLYAGRKGILRQVNFYAIIKKPNRKQITGGSYMLVMDMLIEGSIPTGYFRNSQL